MDTNWIEVNNRSEIWNFDYDQFSRLAQYFHSIYWALYSSSSIGYYDILATNNLETLTVALVLLFGCQMLNGLLGGISTVMRSFSDGVVARQYKMQMIKDLCVHKGLPSSTRDNIYYFFEYQWNRSAGVDESAVLQELPVALRTSIVNEIAGSVLKKIPFFVDCPEFILHEILRMLTTRAFMDQDAIVEAGEYGRDMFIIQSGFAVITPADRSKVFASLGPGDYLGESCLLGLDVKQRAASAYALGYVYTYVLRNIDYAAITDLYPLETAPIEKKIRNVLEQKIAKNNKIIAADHQNETSSCTASETSDFSSNLLTGSSTISMLHPNSKERKIWEVLLLLIVLYNMFMIPLRIAIRLPGKYFMVDYILDIILLLDMYMTYAKFYSIREGRVVTNPEKIKSMFLEQNFKRSFYAYIPFDILAIVMISQTKTYVYWTLTVLRVPKLILSVDYMKHFSAVEDLLDQLKVPYVAGRVANLLLIIIMVGHWAACGFYMLPFLVNKEEEYENCIPEENALYGTACQFEGTWIQMQIMTGKLPLDGGSTWDLYVRSLNWAIPTLTLEVLADIFPINATEMMYAFFAMFFGLILNATVIGTIIGLLSSDEESADVQIVRLLLEERNVHPLLRNKVINYLTFLNSNYGKLVQSEEQLIRELPFSLQSSIIEKSKLVLLEKCPIFDYCSQESKRNLCFALKLQIFGDGDTIIKSGDMGNEMFFLSEGSVQVFIHMLTYVCTVYDSNIFLSLDLQ
jgi:CRP-like cAMP-binding protein